MRVLHLKLKRKWFDMFMAGIKKEEYREIKPYWYRRLKKEYDCIKFENGYNKGCDYFYIKLNKIRKGIGKKEWGAPDYPVYILECGEILK